MATNKKINEKPAEDVCMNMVIAMKDSVEVLTGRWKLPIIVTLLYGPKRFKQISKVLNGVTDKVLSKELKDLEANKLISRTVYDAFPPVVEYAITEHGKSLEKVIIELANWGKLHRKKIIGG